MDLDGGVAIALAALTFLLVLLTAAYAWQTRNTVQELRRQREQTERRDADEKVAAVVATRADLLNELRQIAANLESPSGTGRNFMRLPTAAWHATFSTPAILPEGLRERLFEVYAEVERLNTLARMMLAGTSGASQSGPNFANANLGLDRHGAGESLAQRIQEILPEFNDLPPADRVS